MSKTELIQRLAALESEQGGATEETRLRHDLQVHQFELEMQNRELREAQEELENSRDRYAQLYDFAPISYLNMDAQGIIRALNLAAASFLGRERSFHLGQSFTLRLEPESTLAFREHLHLAFAVREQHAIELNIRLATGRHAPVLVTTVFNESLAPEHGQYLCTLQDLTLRKQSEELQEQLARDLERKVAERTTALREINRDMELFTASVAHDVRAPLRLMRGYAELLREEFWEQLGETYRDYITRIASAADRLDRLLLDLLEYSRISNTEVKLQSIDLRRLVEELATDQKAANHGLDWKLEVDGPEVTVLAHSSVLRQALWNLLENARKFVSPGVQPHIRIFTEPRGRTARVWVTDNGIGIEPAYQDKIFSLFERLHAGSYTGSGVGLATAKRAIARMGGRIGVESDVGKGSRFWVELLTTEPARDRS